MWEIIWYDVMYKIKTKLNELTTNHLQLHYSIMEVAGALFGGKKSDRPEPMKVEDMDAQQAVDGLNNLFRMAGGG